MEAVGMMKAFSLLGGALFTAALAMAPARAEQVDLQLVLAVDVSGSIDSEEYQMQHEGYADAFSSQQVVDAILSGEMQKIAVTYVEWSGAGHQRQLVPWTIVSDRESAKAFAEQVKSVPRVFSDWTSISDAIDFSVALFPQSGHQSERMVLDISGDGVNNNGRPVQEARDEAVAKGIIINGLPILNEDPTLDTYYSDNVIGGIGAFKIPVKDFDTFTSALMSKLCREIAGREDPNRKFAGDLPSSAF
jgi:hypothetical protein